ncbi:MAG: AAA family ATPase [Deltaproteobacteria bacterium]|jgi:hypothetical protein|nr:AAA family ATPase [Deltaproteobacteria bacterium]
MVENSLTPVSGQTFKDIIEEKIIYVDKTAILSNLIETPTKTWFLSRPRRFGKSLTVSTLESIFSGEKELFKGLAIENRLQERRFSRRPVIYLDMSKLDMITGVHGFEKSLNILTVRVGRFLGIDLPAELFSITLITILIEEVYLKYQTKMAILIDEYDTPVTDFLDSPKERNAVLNILYAYYREINANDRYISFVFVTGKTKYIQGGLYSAFNTPTDISFAPDFGALTGFTHTELECYYASELDKTAEHLKILKNDLLEQMRHYYNGFCFDGVTYVYNPYLILQFLFNKKFLNYWYNYGTPKQLIAEVTNY